MQQGVPVAKELGRFSCRGEFTIINMKIGDHTKIFKYGFGTNGDPDDISSPKMTVEDIMERIKLNLEKDFGNIEIKSTSTRGGVIYLAEKPENS